MVVHPRIRFAVLAALLVVVWSSSQGLMSLSNAAAADASRPLPPRRPVILVLGDSTTQYGGGSQGWEVLLHEAYVRSVDTINRGLSGYNTRLFLKYAMPGINEELRNYYTPTVIVIWFGVNDATLADGPNHRQHIPLDEYRQNLITMITQLRSNAPDTKILLLSPGYIDENQRQRAMVGQGRRPGDPLDRNNEQTIKYAAVCSEVAAAVEREEVAYLDVYDYFVKNYPSNQQRADILGDGLHFSTHGNRVFYELVKSKIETMVPASTLHSMQFPTDQDIDRLEAAEHHS